MNRRAGPLAGIVPAVLLIAGAVCALLPFPGTVRGSDRSDASSSPASAGVPLLRTRWNQRSPYNDLCPMGDGGRTAAGCGVIAIAQIMRYHAWPPAGTGTASYGWDGDQSCGGNVGGGTLSADLADPYDWSRMPDACGEGCTADQKSALAELCYEAGVASEADYGNCGTSIYPADLTAALIDRFRYADGITVDGRSAHSAEAWFSMIRAEIDARRPLLYAVPGHAVVCDGWRVDGGRNQIHVNWGDGGGEGTGWWTVDSLPGGHDPMTESLYRGIRPQVRVRSDGTGDFATIQAAVDRLPGGGVIELEGGVYRGSGNRDIDLRGRRIEIRGIDGDPSACVIDCEGSPETPHRGFYLHSGEGEGTVLRDFTIRNGHAQDGGAIHCRLGCAVTLERMIVDACIAAADGGGLFSSQSSPTISSCTFVRCRAGEHGGAMRAVESDVVVGGCTFLLDDASGGGGSVSAGTGSAVTIDRSIIALGAGGGAIECSDGGAVAVSCTDIFGNVGGDWTGCVSDLAGVDGNFELDPLICDTTADDWSLSFASPCSPARNPTCGLVGAWAVGNCGAGAVVVVRPDGSGDFPTIQAAVDAAVDSVEILLGDGTFRGAGNRDIDLHGKRLTIRSESNRPESCTIDCEGSGSLRRRAFRMTSGEGASTIIRGITIVNGLAPSGSGPGQRHGGAIFCENASPTIDRCVFRSNRADASGVDPRGGAIACAASGATISNCIFEANDAGKGGAIGITGGSPRLEACSFVANTAGNGGAVHARDGAAPVIAGSGFDGNEASDDGGAVMVDGADLELDGCELRTNRAQWGGGIAILSGSLTADSCTFVGNAAQRQGGAIRGTGDVVLRACTFHGNTGFGSGLYLTDATLDASRTIIAFGNAYAIRSYGAVTFEMGCCDLYGNVGGDWYGGIAGLLGQSGNISADPMFCDTAGGNFRLDPESPCGAEPPGNPACDRMGAWDTGCTSSAPSVDGPAPGRTLRVIGPNPSSGDVRFALPPVGSRAAGSIAIEIFDLAGRRIRRLAPVAHSPADVVWDGADERGARMPSGIYLARIAGVGDGVGTAGTPRTGGAVRIVLVR